MTRPIPRRATGFGAALVLVLLLAGCLPSGDGATGHAPDGGGITTDDALVAASGPTTETVTMIDPIEQSFTVEVPQGWNSTAYSSGGFDVHREIVSTVSPDGGTVIFLGDPKVPNYWNPDLATDLERQMADVLEILELRSYEPAEMYFANWVKDAFSALDGFEITDIESDQQTADNLIQQFQAAGVPYQRAHAVKIRFDYRSSAGEAIHALVFGMTIDGVKMWFTDVGGIATNRDPDDYVDMMSAMSRSKQTSPEWQARRQANQQQTMAQMEAFTQQMVAQHNANMAWIQQSAASHQAHMQAVWAANDASMTAYYDHMSSLDSSQQQFINSINDEHTVAGPDGQTWQVTTGATNYYLNPATGGYTGGDVNFGSSDLIALGYDPDDFVQVTVVG